MLGKFLRLLIQDVKRSLTSKNFIIASLFMFLIEILSSGQPLFYRDYDVVGIIDNLFSGSGSSDILLMMLPLLPYALQYAQEEQDRAVGYWMIRVGPREYITSKLFAACLSAFLSIIFSFALLSVFLICMGHPFYQMTLSGYGYGQFLVEGKPWMYYSFYLCDRGMTGMMTAACAVFLSTVFPYRFFSFTGPICLYFIALRVVPASINYQWARPSSWMDGTYDSPAGPLVSLLCKIGVTVLVCGIFTILSTQLVRKRWSNG